MSSEGHQTRTVPMLGLSLVRTEKDCMWSCRAEHAVKLLDQVQSNSTALTTVREAFCTSGQTTQSEQHITTTYYVIVDPLCWYTV